MQNVRLNNGIKMPILGFGVFQIHDQAECEKVVLDAIETDYLDLYLMHQPYSDVFGSWRAMQKLYAEGKIKAIGVANFYSNRLIDLIVNSGFSPATNQIETHPFHQQIEAQEFMTASIVEKQSSGPFAEGKNDILKKEILKPIAVKYNKSVAQVILRWRTQRGVIVTPKSVRKERMAENFDIFNFQLSDAEMQTIQALDNKTSLFFDHRDPQLGKRVEYA
jgi:2,5-diketo-D-gluconate reductase A